MNDFNSDYIPPPDTGLDIIYSDEHLLVVNKPSGLLSVPGRGVHKQDCLIHRVQSKFSDALIVHRLDMPTSGLFLLARGGEVQRAMSIQFQERQVEKQYEALVDGCLEHLHGEVDLPLITDWPNRPRQKVDMQSGKPSLTRYQVLGIESALEATRVALYPITGRSHQLRVHMLALGHAILGDDLYASEVIRGKADQLQLHACQLKFNHPVSNKTVVLTSPAPF